MKNLTGLFVVGFIVMSAIAGFYAVQTSDLTSRNQSISSDYANLESRYHSLSTNYSLVSSSLNRSYYVYNRLLANYSRTQIIFRPPSANQSIPIWNIKQTIAPGQYKEWNLLDTFINHIDIRSNQTATFIILDLNDFADYAKGMNYTSVVTNSTNHFKYEMHLSQGCATYVLLIVNHSNSTAEIAPNVTATYAPTPFLTGQCAMP